MKVVQLPRQAGKTDRAVAWLHQDARHRVLVVATTRDRNRLMLDYQLSLRQVMTWQELLGGRLQGRSAGTEVAIDDLDRCLEQLSHAPVRLVTITQE